MRPCVYFRLCGVLLWLLPLSALAQRHYFHTYTSADGLSQLVVQTLLQDRQGYVWIGTQAGLNRFNGFGFETFGLRDGLAGDFIWALAEGPDGSLWIGTRTGLSRRDPNGRITSFDLDDDLPSPEVRVLTITADSTVWLGTPNGLAYLRQGQIYRVEALGPQPVLDLFIDRSKQLYVATQHGLYRWAPPRWVPVPLFANGAHDDRAEGAALAGFRYHYLQTNPSIVCLKIWRVVSG